MSHIPPNWDYKLITKKLKKQNNKDNNELVKGTYKSNNWTNNYQDVALILWDLDQGSWKPNRLNEWFRNVEKIVYEKFKLKDCKHYGAINCNAPNKECWNNIFSKVNNPDDSIFSTLWKFNSCIEVLECKKQAVDKRLINFSKNILNRNEKPKLIVLISHDSDMIPILRLAKKKSIQSMVIRWRKKSFNSKKKCKITPETDLSILVDKDKCIEIDYNFI